MTETTARGRGRPPFGDKPMKHVHVRLDEETIAGAKLIGDGNVSEGIRRAVTRILPRSVSAHRR